MNNELSNSFENIKDYKTDIENILGYINNKVDVYRIKGRWGDKNPTL